MGCFLFRRRSKQERAPPSSKSEENATEPLLNDIIRFSLGELKTATHNFEEKIGEGSFGAVYKGLCKLKLGKSEEIVPVAVKKLNIKGVQGQREWLSEITLLRMVDHPNVVKLIGYCVEDDERGPESLLVYEYMPNKSLDYHIFERSGSLLPWKQRLQIAVGTARGLAYLHEEMRPQIIFRDLKAANILLDDEFQPKLSDFGLARHGPNVGDTHVTTLVVGTAGYAAPDYVQTGHLTAKSDVWSFGMVLLELVTGRKALDWNRPRSERNLGEWARPYMNDSKRFQKIIDPRLKRDYPLDEARGLLSLVQKCTAKHPKTRPNMSEVVQMLLQITDFPSGGSMMRTIDEEARSASYRGSSVSGSVENLSGYFSSKEAEGNSQSRREQISKLSSVKSSNSRSELSGAGRDQLIGEQKEDGTNLSKSSGFELGRREDAENRSLEVVREENSAPLESLQGDSQESTGSDSKSSLQEDARSRGNLNLKEDAWDEYPIMKTDINSSLDEDTKNDYSAGLDANLNLPEEAQENVSPSKSSQQETNSSQDAQQKLSTVSPTNSSREEDAPEEHPGTKNGSAAVEGQQLAEEERLSMETESMQSDRPAEDEVKPQEEEGVSQARPHQAESLDQDVRHSSSDDMYRQGQQKETTSSRRRHREKQDEADPPLARKESDHAGTV